MCNIKPGDIISGEELMTWQKLKSMKESLLDKRFWFGHLERTE